MRARGVSLAMVRDPQRSELNALEDVRREENERDGDRMRDGHPQRSEDGHPQRSELDALEDVRSDEDERDGIVCETDIRSAQKTDIRSAQNSVRLKTRAATRTSAMAIANETSISSQNWFGRKPR